MGKNHLKRLASSKAWELPRKSTIYLSRPSPGGHALAAAVPLTVLLRDMLGVVKTAREGRYVLLQREVLVDAKRRRAADFPIGLMDTIALPQSSQYFRMIITRKGTLAAIPIPSAEQQRKLCRITGKKVRDDKTFQLAVSDGRTLRVEQKTAYQVGDSVLLELPSQKILEHYPLAVGASVCLIGGTHCGSIGSITRAEGGMVNVRVGDLEFQTPKRYAFVVGKEKPAVTIAAQGETNGR